MTLVSHRQPEAVWQYKRTPIHNGHDRQQDPDSVLPT